MTPLRALARGKVNLCLFLGAPRADGLHELVSVVAPLDLADTVTLEPADRDEVVCPGVPGDNLALRALRAFRAQAAPDLPPMRITIDKRIPVAAGMGGGSADAAAVLRLAAEAAGTGEEVARALAPNLGADVPALLAGGRVLMEGAGERVTPLPIPTGSPATLAVLPSRHQLSTPAVYAEADRLGLGRDLAGLADAVRDGAWSPHNDLQPAAISLFPEIEDALERLRGAGAEHALVAGSGPTTFGIFKSVPELPGAILAREAPA